MRARGRLLPCAACRRHLRADEPRCPFCGAQRTPSSPVGRLLPRLGRGAAYALAASLSSMPGAGCRTQPWEAEEEAPATVADAARAPDLTQAPRDLAVVADLAVGDAIVDMTGMPIYGSPPPRGEP